MRHIGTYRWGSVGYTVIGIGMIFSLFSLVSCNEALPVADLIITNANIWTEEEGSSRAEAMAIAGGKIIAIGSEQSLLKHKNTKTIIEDVEGRFVVSGLIDSHVHLMTGGRPLSEM